MPIDHDVGSDAPGPSADGETVDPRALDSEPLHRLFDLWLEKRQGRELPARGDFYPEEMKFILGNLLMLDVLPGRRFRFRLHGSNLALRAGYDMTGRGAEELPDMENRRVLLARCRAVVEGRKPVGVRKTRPVDGRRFSYEALWLPLSWNGTDIDMLMCGLIYLDSWSEARPERS